MVNRTPEHADDAAEGRRRDGLLTTGDMARLSGSTLRTVRFYEEAGLLEPRQRTDGGHRLFARRELDKLNFVSDLRAAGLSLDEIKALLDLKHRSGSGSEAAEKLRARVDAQIRSIRERLAVLERVQGSLQTARDVVTRCHACTSSPLFPERCSECGAMADEAAHVPAVSVLWKLNRGD